MAVVAIRDAISGKVFQASEGYRMYLYAESTGTLAMTIPFAPRQIEYGGWAQQYSEAERSGQKPLLLRKGEALDTIKFSVTLANRDPLFSQASALTALKALAKTRERVLVRYAGTEAGLWRITNATVTSEQRHPDSNEVTQATVSLEFTAASDAAPGVGPVSKPPAPPASPPAPARRTYTVVAGDCLWNIAQRFYGNGSLWPRIHDANRGLIKDPHWIYPNQVFVIP